MIFASRHRQIATMQLGNGRQQTETSVRILEAGGPAFSALLALSKDARYAPSEIVD